MVIIPTNNLGEKLLYLWFHFQNVLKTARHCLLCLPWGRQWKLIDILGNKDYDTIYFWTYPISSHPNMGTDTTLQQGPFS